MSKIFFKLKSRKDFDHVIFDGYSLSVFDLKREIILAKKLGKGPEFDIALDDAQTGEEYTDDNFQVPKNSSVIVRVIPATQYKSAQRYLTGASQMPRGSQLAVSKALPTTIASSAMTLQLNNTPAAPATTTIAGETEADKIQSLFQQSDDQWKKDSLQIAMSQTQKGLARRNQQFTSEQKPQQPQAVPTTTSGSPPTTTNAAAPSAPTGATAFNPYGMDESMREPPSYYVCFRCGVKGHWLKFCPTHGNRDYDNFRVKKTTGIPRTFLKGLVNNQPVPAVPQQQQIVKPDANLNLSELMANVGEGHTVMVTPEGELVIAKINTDTFDRLTASSGSTLISMDAIHQQLAALEQQQNSKYPPNTFIPLHLKCKLCGLVVRDAVKIQCCQSLFCDSCIRAKLAALFEQQASLNQQAVVHQVPCPACAKPVDADRIVIDKPSRALADQHLRNIMQLLKDMAESSAADADQEEPSDESVAESLVIQPNMTALQFLGQLAKQLTGFQIPPASEGSGQIAVLPDSTEERSQQQPQTDQGTRSIDLIVLTPQPEPPVKQSVQQQQPQQHAPPPRPPKRSRETSCRDQSDHRRSQDNISRDQSDYRRSQDSRDQLEYRRSSNHTSSSDRRRYSSRSRSPPRHKRERSRSRDYRYDDRNNRYSSSTSRRRR